MIKKKERMTKNRRDLKSTEWRAGEETDRAIWRRKIVSHIGLHDGKSQGKEEKTTSR